MTQERFLWNNLTKERYLWNNLTQERFLWNNLTQERFEPGFMAYSMYCRKKTGTWCKELFLNI